MESPDPRDTVEFLLQKEHKIEKQEKWRWILPLQKSEVPLALHSIEIQ
jgi:hypothetical protein